MPTELEKDCRKCIHYELSAGHHECWWRAKPRQIVPDWLRREEGVEINPVTEARDCKCYKEAY